MSSGNPTGKPPGDGLYYKNVIDYLRKPLQIFIVLNETFMCEKLQPRDGSTSELEGKLIRVLEDKSDPSSRLFSFYTGMFGDLKTVQSHILER